MAAHPMSAEEFLEIHGDGEEDRYELIDGEICARTLNGYLHDRVKNNFKEVFDRSKLDRNSFRCWIGHTFQMGDFSLMTPDVAIVRTERVLHHRGFTAGSPEIPIEVALSDNPGVLQRKISSYLRNGAHAVCCAYPDLRNLVVYTAHEWRELTMADELAFPALIPGISIPVSAIFEGI